MTLLSAIDRIEIHERLARYAWALDTGDVDAFVDCFHPDGELLWDSFEQPACWRGAASLREFCAYFRALPGSAGRQHHVTNVIVDALDDGARVRSYVVVILRQPDGAVATTVLGYYEDRFTRGDDRAWRIRERAIRDWAGPVLAAFAGQDGARSMRERPAALAGLFATAVP
jgi:hypothetical protein